MITAAPHNENLIWSAISSRRPSLRGWLSALSTFLEPDGTAIKVVFITYCPRASARFSFATDIARGMSYLHQHRICHGRLKSLNCVLDDRWVCKITGNVYNYNHLMMIFSFGFTPALFCQITDSGCIAGRKGRSCFPRISRDLWKCICHPSFTTLTWSQRWLETCSGNTNRLHLQDLGTPNAMLLFKLQFIWSWKGVKYISSV